MTSSLAPRMTHSLAVLSRFRAGTQRRSLLTKLVRALTILGLGLSFTACASDEGKPEPQAVSSSTKQALAVTDLSEPLAIALPQDPDPMFVGLQPTAEAPTRGMWSPVFDWPMNGLHSVVLPTGRVLTYGTPQGNAATQDGRTLDVWDPGAGFGASSHATNFDAQRVNSFCSSAAFNADGSLLISGGNSPLASSVFAPATGAVGTSPFQMAAERWYGSMLTLPDGRFLMMGGSGPYEALRAYQDPAQAIAAGSVSLTPEIYEPATGFRSLFGAYSREAFGPDHHRYWYPRAWVAPNGDVFGISSEKMWRLDYSGDGSVTVLGDFKTGADAVTRPNIGPTSAAVMFAPGRILQVGGNGYHDGHALPGSALATVVDINGGQPVLTETNAMSFGRQWPSLTVLPDGKVVVTGGTRFSNNGGADAVYTAELWDPATGEWSLGADAAVIRVYHSAAILMPNGTLLSTGGGAPGPVNNLNAEVYYPPYLFRAATGGGVEVAPRPRALAISSLSPQYAEDVNLDLAGNSTITSAVLIGASSTTHSFNTSQRRMELPFLQDANRVAVEMPANGNAAPPGYYELFLIDDAGVPSPGVLLSLGEVAPPPVQIELPRGHEITLEAVDPPGYAMATDGSNLGGLAALGDDPTPAQLLSAQFVARDGLADASCVSFESVAVPGQWLRHYGYRLRLGTNNGTALFQADATFCPEAGLAGSGFSFRSKNFPDRVIRHRDYQLWIDPVQDTVAFRSDATFVLRELPLPEIPPIDAPITEVDTSLTYAPGLSVPGASFTWDFGDGSAPIASSTSSGTHVYASPGVYLVTFTVTLSDGRSVVENFVQGIHAPLISGISAQSSQMGFSPSGQLWVVNPDNDTVAVFAVDSLNKVAEIAVGESPESLAFAGNGDAWVVSRDGAGIAIIDSTTFAVLSTRSLPQASRPFGLVFTPDFQSAYLSLEALGQIVQLDSATAAVQQTLDVGATPRGLALTADGSRLLVSRFISPPVPGEETTAPLTQLARAELFVVDLPAFDHVRIIGLAHSDLTDNSVQGRGVPNYLGAPLITPEGSTAWIPSKQDNIARGVSRDGQNLDFQNTVRSVISKIDLNAESEELAERVDLDNAGLATAAALHPSGIYLFVTLETSREVAVVNALNGTELFRIAVGRAPQGVVVSEDGTQLFVKNFMDRSVSAFDLTPLVDHGKFESVALATASSVASELLPSQILLGKQLFYDAADTRLARDGYLSCATCHADGADDGRVWDLSGFGEGLRNTISLAGRAGATGGFLHWSSNFDEVQDFEGQIRALSAGTGLMSDAQFLSGTVGEPLGDLKTGMSAELDALAAYVNSLALPVPSPYRDGDELTPTGAAGRETFAVLGCNECHYGASFSDEDDQALVDIGTLTAASGQRLFGPLDGIDVPSLLGAWSSPPYLHDGSALSLSAAILAHNGQTASDEELSELVAFVSQIDAREPVLPRFGCADGVKNAGESDVDCGGACAGCVDGAICSGATDCLSGICTGGICEAAPSCADGVQNGGEVGVDCGSVCGAGCVDGTGCATPADCSSNLCDQGNCVPAPSCTDGAVNQDESDTDCGGVCPACPEGATCVIPADCGSSLCTAGVCDAAPTCSDSILNQNESDTDCGGVCPGCLDGSDCSQGSDCESGLCPASVCVPAPTCSDSIFNQDESDTDCGGVCPSCPDGATCLDSTDCQSAICGGGLCAPAPICVDSLKNQNESDVDCGGVCPACNLGQDCTSAGDCQTAFCDNGTCAVEPTCTDSIVNQDESDMDCGGGCELCPDGAGCFGPGDCESGLCSGGVCEPLPALPAAVFIQAESGVLSGSPTFAIAADSTASGGQYLSSTSNNTGSAGPNRVTYTVDVAEGEYVLWGRVIAPSADDDSFWVSVDGSAFVRWNDISRSTQWVWDEVHNTDAGGATMRYVLDAGTHSIVIANREDGVRLDMLYLTADGDVPIGMGPPSCDDGIQNGDEEGVDCGGTSCDLCSTLPTSLYLEAEAAMFSGSPAFNVVSNSSASGGFALSPTSNNTGSPGPNRAVYGFQVQSGSYVLWGRVIAPSGNDDSFWVSVDGGPFIMWNNIAPGSSWHWDEVHDSNAGGAPVRYNLSEGYHKVEFANREDGVLLDQLFISSDGSTP